MEEKSAMSPFKNDIENEFQQNIHGINEQNNNRQT
jgi:hypothetical protein